MLYVAVTTYQKGSGPVVARVPFAQLHPALQRACYDQWTAPLPPPEG